MSGKQPKQEAGRSGDRSAARYAAEGGVPRHVVYDLHAVPLDTDARPTAETCRQADRLFDERAARAPSYRRSKVAEKRAYFRTVLHAAKRAVHRGGCVRYRRGLSHPDCTKARLQVIDAAVEAGLFVEVRSKPGSPKMSRLLPTPELASFAEADPWAFDPPDGRQYVFLRDRDSGEEITFDPAHPVAAAVQARLELVNETLAGCRVEYRRYDRWQDVFAAARTRLRPVHYARFTDDFAHHGRLYTGRYGHQALRKLERQTIRIDGRRTVELDFSGFHCRLLYHLDGIDYRRDPYALWGEATTGPQRLMAKFLVNALINARDEAAAVAACNQRMNPRTRPDATGRVGWKRGKAADTARRLREARDETGLRFAALARLARRVHHRIAHRFGSDAGMGRLMGLDGAVALDVLAHFAGRGVPCLGVHDSFIVPRSAKAELVRVMRRAYRERVGFYPVIKGVD